MSKFDDYNALINGIAKEQAERRENTLHPTREEALKSAEKLYKMGIPLESIGEGLGLTTEQLRQHFARHP